MRRGTLAALLAAGIVAGFVLLLYAFVAYVWPLLPVWANIVVVIGLSLGLVFSPMVVLLRLDKP